ncbi:MAG: HNH endonuclease [Rhodospirillaceae bacterium]
MPTLPAKICSCGHRHPGGQRCPVCTARRDAEYRRPERDAFYRTREWKHIADTFRAMRSGVCECCGAFGASTVDHITPRARGGLDDYSNLQLLCGSCHSRKSALEGSRWTRRAAL